MFSEGTNCQSCFLDMKLLNCKNKFTMRDNPTKQANSYVEHWKLPNSIRYLQNARRHHIFLETSTPDKNDSKCLHEKLLQCIPASGLFNIWAVFMLAWNAPSSLTAAFLHYPTELRCFGSSGWLTHFFAVEWTCEAPFLARQTLFVVNLHFNYQTCTHTRTIHGGHV